MLNAEVLCIAEQNSRFSVNRFTQLSLTIATLYR